MIGHLPELTESEIDGRPIPIPVTLPITINGRIFPREDVDIWTFTGKQGHSYVCEVNAARISSPLDSRLEILGPDGLTIAENTDHFGNDSFLRFTAPTDGTYQVRIHDLKFLGLQTYVYRLTITDGPWVEQTYPLGVQRGVRNSLTLLGQNLPDRTVTVDVPDHANRTIGRSLSLASGHTNIFALAVSDHPNVLETDNNNTPQSAQPVNLPAVLNGHIETVGDIDHFVFVATKGQSLVMDLQAARLGSSLDARIAVLDENGKQVAAAEDGKKTSDPTLTFKAPADGRFTVLVAEQEAGRGGDRFAYHLEIAPPITVQPGFQLTLPGDAITVARDAEAKFKINVTRSGGFSGEIALQAILAAATIHDFVRESMTVAVAVPAPFKFTGIFESQFGPQGTTFYRRYTIVRNGYTGPLTATMADTQIRHLQGISCRPMPVPDKTDQFDFQIQLPTWLEVGRTSRTQMLLVGIVVDPDGTRHKVSYTSNTQSDQTIVLATSGVVGVNTTANSILARPGHTVE